MLPQDRSELPARYPRERYPRPWKLLAGVSILPVYQTALLCNVHYQTQLGSGGWEKIPRRELEQLRRQRAVVVAAGGVSGGDVIPPTPTNLAVPPTTRRAAATRRAAPAALGTEASGFDLSLNRRRSQSRSRSRSLAMANQLACFEGATQVGASPWLHPLACMPA